METTLISTDATEEEVGAQLRILGGLVGRALDAASKGKQLTAKDRRVLSQWLLGEDWFREGTSMGSEEAKIVQAQIMVLGADLRKALVRIGKDGQLSGDERRELRDWLYISRRLQRRVNRRRGIYYLVFCLGVLIATLFIRPHIPVGGLTADPTWIPFILAAAILVGAIVKDIYIDRNIDTALSDIKWVSEKTKEDMRDMLEKNLRPRIIPLDTSDKVLKAASDILLEAIEEIRDHRFVIFIGAASLSTKDALEVRDEDKMSPVEEYKSRLLNLEGAKVPVTRYIYLIKPSEFQQRKAETRKEYLKWLDRQITLLKDNSKYVLKDCFRSQPWGGSRSSIITHKAFLDIVGGGQAGFLIKGEEVARTLKESSEKLFESANQHTYKGGEEASISALRSMYNGLKGKV
jgi:hypothetical protein